MLHRSALSRDEYRLLGAITLASVPVTIALLVICFPFNNHWGVDPVVAYFRYSVLITLSISRVFIGFRLISVSVLTFTLPIGLFLNWIRVYYARWQNLIEINLRDGAPDDGIETGFMSLFLGRYLEYCDYIMMGIVIALVIWNIRILIRSKTTPGIAA